MYMVYFAAVLIVAAALLILFNFRMLRRPQAPGPNQTQEPAPAPAAQAETRERMESESESPAARTAGDDGPEEGDRAYRSAIRRESGAGAEAAEKPPAEPENPAYADDTYRGALRSLKRGDKS